MLRFRKHAIVALLVAPLLVGLTPLAYADLPDPTWIDGYWEDDELDDVVVFMDSASAIVAPSVVDAGLLLVPVAWVAPAEPNAGPATLCSAACSRAPPASASSHC